MTHSENAIELGLQGKLLAKLDHLQQHAYDCSREILFLGREKLINRLALQYGRILEIGCGKGSNLLRLARKNPALELYGIEASRELALAAKGRVQGSRYRDRIQILHAFADRIDWDETFNLREPFDTVFFAYSLSRLRNSEAVIQCALSNLKAEGSLFVLDFWDQKDHPVWLRTIARRCQKCFQLGFNLGDLSYLLQLPKNGLGRTRLSSVLGRYAYLAEYR